nr:sirohydrochlorin cobaltochelatase [uncultured Blautia sp.]
MKRKSMLALLLAVSMTCSMTAATGTVAFAEDAATEESADDAAATDDAEATDDTAADASEATDDASADADASSDDQKAADEVGALIDKIYVQERTDTTDDDCKAAKEAWDKLTDAQKELVTGENADPDYFGRDTGDASKDDPRNQDEIGENELLVVSFGTSFNDSRAEDVKGIEDALAAAYPDWSVRRAFTAQIIINHVEARDNEVIDNMQQALDRAVANGVKNLVVQPTHLMHGAEYDEMTEAIDGYKDKFESVAIAEPMLGEVGDDATVINDDKKAVAQAITDEACKVAGFDDMKAAADAGTAFVFMGHGTSHTANVTYDQMQAQMDDLGFTNAFIGTVEGKPEDTACDKVIEKVKEAGFKNVILRPLMVVAGDHANNDMAGDDEDSWKSQFVASGDFDSVDCQIEGLGRIAAVEDLYVAHTKAAIDSLGATDDAAADENAEAADDETASENEATDETATDNAAADETATEEADAE